MGSGGGPALRGIALVSTFDTAFDRVFTNEGGYQNDPRDRGNWTSGVIGVGELKGTKFGLAAMTYPHLDMKNVTLSEAKNIYHQDWWLALGMDSFRPAMAYQLFDAAINHGMYNATKMLQRSVGAYPDGQIGPRTLASLFGTDLNDALLCFLAHRLEFMTNVYTWPEYGKGWARRIAHNLKLAAEDN